LKEKIKLAVWSEVNPCTARERETSSRNSRIGAQLSLSMLSMPSAEALCRRPRNSRVWVVSSESLIRRSPLSLFDKSRIHSAWRSALYFLMIAGVLDFAIAISGPPPGSTGDH
jgi:hypothetical protein